MPCEKKQDLEKAVDDCFKSPGARTARDIDKYCESETDALAKCNKGGRKRRTGKKSRKGTRRRTRRLR